MTIVQTFARVERLYASPARLAAAVAGWWWVSNLLVGLLISHDFSTSPVHGTDAELLFIPVAVNGWHLLVHGVVGVIGLIAASRIRWASAYLGFFGAFQIAWGVAGLAAGGTFWLTYADLFGSWVHVVEGALLLLALAVARRRAGSSA